jgi:hypothetical protein
VPNLADLPEYQRYCIGFTPGLPVEPALVIPFSTTINFGQNFFGWPAGGDNDYDSTHFATQIRSVGVWFANYNHLGGGMLNTPRVYLVPAGTLHTDRSEGLDRFIHGALLPNGQRDGINLIVPNGTAGTTPTLRLSYESGSGNGPLGLGWDQEPLQKDRATAPSPRIAKPNSATVAPPSGRGCGCGVKIEKCDKPPDPLYLSGTSTPTPPK